MWRHWILGFILCLTEYCVEMLHNNFNVFYSNMIYIEFFNLFLFIVLCVICYNYFEIH